MKKELPILLFAMWLLSACVKDDISNCSGVMHFNFSYLSGGTNRFFELVETDVHFSHYKEGNVYRETTIRRSDIDINTPWRVEKTPDDKDTIGVVAWSHDDALIYTAPAPSLESGNVHLKEITEGSGICLPVKDLFYGNLKFDAGDRQEQNRVIVPCERAICRIRITVIPQTIEPGEEEPSTRENTPNSGNYVIQVLGTYNEIDYNNITKGEQIILQPGCFFDEESGNVMTHWFGAFSSGDEAIMVNIYLDGVQIAHFDCTPVGLNSIPGRFIDLVVDGRYAHPMMEVRVNGWKVADVKSDM